MEKLQPHYTGVERKGAKVGRLSPYERLSLDTRRQMGIMRLVRLQKHSANNLLLRPTRRYYADQQSVNTGETALSLSTMNECGRARRKDRACFRAACPDALFHTFGKCAA